MVLTLQTIYAITDNHHRLTPCKMVLLTVSGHTPALVILDFINSSPTLNHHPVIFFFQSYTFTMSIIETIYEIK